MTSIFSNQYLCYGDYCLWKDPHGLLQYAHSGDCGEGQPRRDHHAEVNTRSEDGNASCDRGEPEHENVESCEVDILGEPVKLHATRIFDSLQESFYPALQLDHLQTKTKFQNLETFTDTDHRRQSDMIHIMYLHVLQ